MMMMMMMMMMRPGAFQNVLQTGSSCGNKESGAKLITANF
jgi:hypothetical protein